MYIYLNYCLVLLGFYCCLNSLEFLTLFSTCNEITFLIYKPNVFTYNVHSSTSISCYIFRWPTDIFGENTHHCI